MSVVRDMLIWKIWVGATLAGSEHRAIIASLTWKWVTGNMWRSVTGVPVHPPEVLTVQAHSVQNFQRFVEMVWACRILYSRVPRRRSTQTWVKHWGLQWLGFSACQTQVRPQVGREPLMSISEARNDTPSNRSGLRFSCFCFFAALAQSRARVAHYVHCAGPRHPPQGLGPLGGEALERRSLIHSR